MLGGEALMPERPYQISTGITHGQNMGEDVPHAGTVAAAMEGLSLGIPSIAVSFAGKDLRADLTRLREQVPTLTRVLAHITALPAFPPSTLLNINLPPRSASEIQGIRLTRLGTRVFSQSVTPMKDPWGRQIYWIGGGDITWTGDVDSDFRAIDEGYVSVTPLHLDLTHFTVLDAARTWWNEL